MKVEVELNEDAMTAIGYLTDPIDARRLSPQEVIQALADDLGMTSTRPGSWEGSNMQQVIDGHGWEANLGHEDDQFDED